MNKDRLQDTFQKIKEEINLDYAIVNADEYGDCMTYVNYEIGVQFGMQSKGIWVKHFDEGMNKGPSWSELESVYIAHDLNEDQANKMIDLLQNQGYEITPKIYDRTKCFEISEKENVDISQKKWKSINVNKQNIETMTSKSALIKMPHNSEYDGYKFWHPAKLIRQGRNSNSVSISYTDNFTFKLKKYGNGDYNKYKVISEIEIDVEKFEKAFEVMDKNITSKK